MKKILAVSLISLLISGNIYPDISFSVKSVYKDGSLAIKSGQNGRIYLGKEFLTFSFKNKHIEIPFSSISQLSWSEKKKNLNNIFPSLIEKDLITNGYEPQQIYIPKIKHERSPFGLIGMIIAFALVLFGVLKMLGPKKVYLRIDFKPDIRNEWAIFEISEKEFNALYPALSKKSGKEIYFYE